MKMTNRLSVCFVAILTLMKKDFVSDASTKFCLRLNWEKKAGLIKTMELKGKWNVKCYGSFKIFDILKDQKVVNEEETEGHNLINGQEWGWFYVTPEKNGGFKLDYDHEKNPWWMRRIVDYIHPVGDNWWGRLTYGFKEIFEFSLSKATGLEGKHVCNCGHCNPIKGVEDPYPDYDSSTGE